MGLFIVRKVFSIKHIRIFLGYKRSAYGSYFCEAKEYSAYEPTTSHFFLENKSMIRPAQQFEQSPTDAIRPYGEFFKRLADNTRLRILMLLTEDGEMHVQALSDTLKLSQPLVSHHLALLREVGIIEMRRAGKNNFYRLVEGRIDEMFDRFLYALSSLSQPECITCETLTPPPVNDFVVSASA
jgi:ArsR family transcriptional regulator